MSREKQLLIYLKSVCLGRSHCVSGKELSRTLNLTGTDLRKYVNHLRQQRNPIASSQNGYFYAETAGEVYVTIQNLKKMQAGLDAAVQGLEQSLDSFPKGR